MSSDTAPSADPTPSGSLAVVIVNFGSTDLIERNLAGTDLSTIGAEVVVVDNFHSNAERSLALAAAVRCGWTLVPMSSNAGFGAGANAGVAQALDHGASSVLMLNPDASIGAGAVTDMWREAETHPMMLQCPRIVRPDGTVWFDGATLDPRTGDIRSVRDPVDGGWLTGACLMVSGELWRACGGFDPEYFMYWEDIDLSRRAMLSGGDLRVRHDLTVVHAVGATQGVGKSTTYLYYNCRNRLVYAAKHLPRGQLLRWMLATPSASWRILRRSGGRRSILRSPHLVLATVRGALAGLLVGAVTLVRG